MCKPGKLNMHTSCSTNTHVAQHINTSSNDIYHNATVIDDQK